MSNFTKNPLWKLLTAIIAVLIGATLTLKGIAMMYYSQDTTILYTNGLILVLLGIYILDHR